MFKGKRAQWISVAMTAHAIQEALARGQTETDGSASAIDPETKSATMLSALADGQCVRVQPRAPAPTHWFEVAGEADDGPIRLHKHGSGHSTTVSIEWFRKTVSRNERSTRACDRADTPFPALDAEGR